MYGSMAFNEPVCNRCWSASLPRNSIGHLSLDLQRSSNVSYVDYVICRSCDDWVNHVTSLVETWSHSRMGSDMILTWVWVCVCVCVCVRFSVQVLWLVMCTQQNIHIPSETQYGNIWLGFCTLQCSVRLNTHKLWWDNEPLEFCLFDVPTQCSGPHMSPKSYQVDADTSHVTEFKVTSLTLVHSWQKLFLWT